MEPNQNDNETTFYNKGIQSPYVNYASPVSSAQVDNTMYKPRVSPTAPAYGVPMFPLYGYDNSDDLDEDLIYMKSIYPQVIQIIQSEVEEECDKLEYDGSCMFDECPDKNHLGAVVNVIFKRVEHLDQENANLQAEQMGPFVPPFIYGRCYGINCPRVPYNHQDGRPNWMRNVIEILLFNEMMNRRRRYRSRRRWY